MDHARSLLATRNIHTRTKNNQQSINKAKRKVYRETTICYVYDGWLGFGGQEVPTQHVTWLEGHWPLLFGPESTGYVNAACSHGWKNTGGVTD